MILFILGKYENALRKLKAFEEEQDSQFEIDLDRRRIKKPTRFYEFNEDFSSDESIVLPKVPNPKTYDSLQVNQEPAFEARLNTSFTDGKPVRCSCNQETKGE